MTAIFRCLNGRVRTFYLNPPYQIARVDCRTKQLIGDREVVGFGYNGQPNYADREHYPMPAIRWKETTAEILQLRKKEEGDWHNLTTEERKKLYRASFCQTFAEFQAPTGEWKTVIGSGLIFTALSFWIFYFYKIFVYSPVPITFDEEHRRAQFRRILDMRNGPIFGAASKWDYDKDDWKN
ncbi:cytochrome c oxidase subunit 4 isoform 1, mitochondrial-like [Diabrotica virgifera virgifera]|uniref:Cytochrome c oxidase subunit 4 n=1 Tax=Diabrotica virgifera virgifera TaxID=50390 RepID=A0ABM5KD15_DIAVI|nr:cytochrome c oxidase subunit 4 isoform 1, mitochondrial-like [Diabrotica virgifera virgifera]